MRVAIKELSGILLGQTQSCRPEKVGGACEQGSRGNRGLGEGSGAAGSHTPPAESPEIPHREIRGLWTFTSRNAAELHLGVCFQHGETKQE